MHHYGSPTLRWLKRQALAQLATHISYRVGQTGPRGDLAETFLVPEHLLSHLQVEQRGWSHQVCFSLPQQLPDPLF